MYEIFHGSFDPFTRGHLNIVSRASRMFDQVCVVIATNSVKIRSYDPEAMCELIKDAILMAPAMSNVNVTICKSSIAEFVATRNVNVVVRALRNGSDLDYEEMVETGNNMLLNSIDPARRVEHVYLMAEPEYRRTSSTLARELILAGAGLSELRQIMPTNIAEYVYQQKIAADTILRLM